MLGFTLSKLNLLILVTAMFAIIAFFLFSLTDMMVSLSAQQMVAGIVETTAGITTSTVPCFKETVAIPREISYFGGKRFFYVMQISREPPEYKEGHLSKLIFKVASRKEPDKFIAAGSIDLNAEILLYQWPVAEGTLASDLKEQGRITLDPMSDIAIYSNSIVLVKESVGGKNFLHVIACSTTAGQCEINKSYVGCCVKKWKNAESSCLPTPKDAGKNDICPDNLSCYARD